MIRCYFYDKLIIINVACNEFDIEIAYLLLCPHNLNQQPIKRASYGDVQLLAN